MDYTVYCLRSTDYRHFYIGQSKDIALRLAKHNRGEIRSTARYRPWKLIYSESYETRLLAVYREKYLKSHAGRRWLKSHAIRHLEDPVADP